MKIFLSVAGVYGGPIHSANVRFEPTRTLSLAAFAEEMGVVVPPGSRVQLSAGVPGDVWEPNWGGRKKVMRECLYVRPIYDVVRVPRDARSLELNAAVSNPRLSPAEGHAALNASRAYDIERSRLAAAEKWPFLSWQEKHGDEGAGWQPHASPFYGRGYYEGASAWLTHEQADTLGLRYKSEVFGFININRFVIPGKTRWGYMRAIHPITETIEDGVFGIAEAGIVIPGEATGYVQPPYDALRLVDVCAKAQLTRYIDPDQPEGTKGAVILAAGGTAFDAGDTPPAIRL